MIVYNDLAMAFDDEVLLLQRGRPCGAKDAKPRVRTCYRYKPKRKEGPAATTLDKNADSGKSI